MDKGRLLALTDGIIAIAATIMVLELNIPDRLNSEALLGQLPTLIAYIISFLQIWIVWHSHHDSFRNAENINDRVFLLNVLWVLCITLYPFVTGILGRDITSKWAELLYIGLLALSSGIFQILDRQLVKANPKMKPNRIRNNRVRIALFGGYIIAAIAACFVPVLGLTIVGVMCAIWIIASILSQRS